MKKYKIAIINGPNMNILGLREREIYGTQSWDGIKKRLEKLGDELSMELVFYQSNHEGNIVDFIQENLLEINGVIINPAAFSGSGYSILDAISATAIPFIDVHLSNIASRGGWHKKDIFSKKAIGVITGFKGYVYDLAVLAIFDYFGKNKQDLNGGGLIE